MITRGRYCIWILLLVGLAGTGCTSRAVHEAQAVVAEADSLRAEGRMYGIDEGDSATLAQAYRTLKKYSVFSVLSTVNYPLATIYAHACYHYGRLLREKDDPVGAMECFINATHTCTRDYPILGRVYSNMGEIAHLASEFQLSYDLFERSAEMFMQAGDTLLYYYDLNNMAFELAEQGKKDETCALIDSINRYCKDEVVIDKTNETKAKLYLQTQQYDSVIHYVNCFQSYGQSQMLRYVFKARALWHKGMIDSALYYANYVLNSPFSSEQNKYNMLYILINGDSTLSNEDIISISARRSDIETDVLIPLHNQWAMSVQLLQHDLNKKPDWGWLYAILATLAIIGIFIFAYVKHKWKKHQLLTQKIDALENQNEERIEDMLKLMDERCSLLAASANLKDTICWKNYDEMCRIIDAQFYLLASKLQQKQILNEKEIRLCILVLIGLNRSSIADILPYALNSVGKFKDHTAKLLGTTGKNLRNYLLKLATV